MEKLEWLDYPVMKKFRRYLIRFGATHERDGRTDRLTPGDGIYRAYVDASRGKNDETLRTTK